MAGTAMGGGEGSDGLKKVEKKIKAREKKSFLLTLLNIDGLITVFSDSARCVQGSSRR